MTNRRQREVFSVQALDDQVFGLPQVWQIAQPSMQNKLLDKLLLPLERTNHREGEALLQRTDPSTHGVRKGPDVWVCGPSAEPRAFPSLFYCLASVLESWTWKHFEMARTPQGYQCQNARFWPATAI